MCSETLIQDYPNRNPFPSNGVSNHLITNAMTSALTNPINTDSNIYMEPNVTNANYLNSGENQHLSNHNHYQTQSQPHCQPNGNFTSNGTSSPLPVLPALSPSGLPSYLSETSHQHQYQTPIDNEIPQYFHDHIIQSQEFLPLCDLLFNIISLAAYFCDVVFDSVTAYTLYLQHDTLWLGVTLFLILCSALISQILSLRWYTNRSKDKTINLFQFQGICVLTIHVFLCGVLWRYFKLFIPVDLSSVKHEVRDLCMLRMVHAFCEAAPMLVIQVYLLWLKPSADHITDLNIISIFLSLFSLCWALASFSKNVRRHNIHKLVLTWLGVIFQFFWRLGTISSRVITLTVYATIYSYWVFAVIILHWFSMLLWLLSPKNLFYGEKMSFIKRVCYSCLVAWVYIFCYINMQEDNSRNKMIAFYSTMFLENTLLLSICIALKTGSTPWFQSISVMIVWGGFAIGMLFMILYYKFFHIRHLKHTLLATHYDPIDYGVSHCPEHGNQPYNDTIHSNSALNGRMNGLSNTTCERKLTISLMNPTSNGVISGIPGVFNCRLNPALKRKKKKPSSFVPPPHPTMNGPNTLNTITSTISSPSSNNVGSLQSNKSVTKTTKAPPVPSPTAFWKKSELANGFLHSQSISPTNVSSPLTLPAKHPFSASIAASPVAHLTDLPQLTNKLIIPPSSSMAVNKELKSNSTSRVNIQQKLQEKKQQQFMQLKKIEEEIKEGKLKPHLLDRIESPAFIHQAIAPQAKKQPWIANSSNVAFAPTRNHGIHHYYYHPVYRRIKLRSQTPEVLLSPHYLDNSRVYYDYPSCVLPPIQSRLLKVPLEGSAEEEEDDNNCKVINPSAIELRNAKNASNANMKANNHTNRFQSDIDSQVSLPRSYTLPREFQYYRGNDVTRVNTAINGDLQGVCKPRSRKPIPNDHFHANVESNSSNDGDVDSDINQDDYGISPVPKIIRGPVNNMRAPAAPIRSREFHHISRYKRHETPL